MVTKRIRIDINEPSRLLLEELSADHDFPLDQKQLIELALRFYKYKNDLADNRSELLEDVLIAGLLKGKNLHEAMFEDYLK